jgi:cytochrome c biogenesis protein CcdA
MLDVMSSPIPEGSIQASLVATAFAFGLRHGFDWDHIAAITDITSSQLRRRRAMWFATLYALGHGVVVLALGTVAIGVGKNLPEGMDRFMGRLVGVTLILLGVYVFYALARDGRSMRMRSRWMLLIVGMSRIFKRLRRSDPPPVEIVHDHDHVAHGHHPAGEHREIAGAGAAQNVAVRTRTHRHPHRHVVPAPADPFAEYGVTTSLGVGAIHGIGAETPTQVLIFVTAAGVGGMSAGLLLLGAFVAGLLVSNTLVAAASTLGLSRADKSFAVYAAIVVLTGCFSLVVGTLFLLGADEVLPLFAG